MAVQLWHDHVNTRRAHREERITLGKRAQLILDFLRRDGGSFTDRELTLRLGFGNDRSRVQPRLSDLVRDGLVEEVGITRCKHSGKSVRVVAAAKTITCGATE